EQRHQYRGQHRQRVERMTDPLKPRHLATAVEAELVHKHEQTLRGKNSDSQRSECHRRYGQGASPIRGASPTGLTRLISEPYKVKPGPKARLTTSVPGFTAGSRNRRSQMCGNVAEDMLPRSKSISREARTCDGSSRSHSSTLSTMRGPPGCTA